MDGKLIVTVNNLPVHYDKSLTSYWDFNEKNDAWMHGSTTSVCVSTEAKGENNWPV